MIGSNTPICTIVSKNYISQARTLARSYLQHNPEGQVFVCLVDRIEDYYDPYNEPFVTVPAEDLNIPHWEHFSFKYDIMELNTAVKPFLLEYLFQTYQLDRLVYFDPDIALYDSMVETDALLDRYGILLTPHILAPLYDKHSPSEIDLLRAGIYNLGYVAVSRRTDLTGFLLWWKTRLYEYCVAEPNKGLFVDQRWMDLAPGMFPNVYVWRDPTANIAYWNLTHRLVEFDGQHYVIDGKPIKFVHYSGFMVDKIEAVSKHQDRFVMTDLSPAMQELMWDYRQRLLVNEYEATKRWPYAYGKFNNGVPIPTQARMMCRELDPMGERWHNPYVTEGDSFYAYLNAPHSNDTRSGTYLTNFAAYLYQSDVGLRTHFANGLTSQQDQFMTWFRGNAEFYFKINEAFLIPLGLKPRPQLVNLPPASGQETEQMLSIRRHFAGWDALRNRDLAIAKKLKVNRVPLVGYMVKTGARVLISGKVAYAQLALETAITDQLNRLDMRVKTEPQPPRFLQIPQAAPTIPATAVPTGSNGAKPTIRGVNVIGYIYSETGVGEVARSTLRSLASINYPVMYKNILTADIARKGDRKIDELKLREGTDYPINLMQVNADQVPYVKAELGESIFKQRHTIGFWFWELSAFPAMWHDRFGMVDEVWVASTFCQKSVAAYSPIPVMVVPVQVEPEVTSGLDRAHFGLPTNRFIFLYVFDALSFTQRKNPLGILRAFKKAFAGRSSADSNPLLVLKISNLSRSSEADVIRAAAAEVGAVIIDDYLSRAEVYGLLNCCDTYVSLHRSEGFGLTMAEAMGLGKPVIATAYSANMDFMTPGNSYPVAYGLVPLEETFGPYEKGQVWADPDEDHAAHLMRQAVDNPDPRIGRRAASDIYRLYNHETVAKAIQTRLDWIYANRLSK